MGQSDASDIGARPVMVLPELEQLGDLVHAKAEVPRAANEAQRVDFVVPIQPVAGLCAGHEGQQVHGLVVTDHLGRHAGACGRLAYVEPLRVHRHRRSVVTISCRLAGGPLVPWCGVVHHGRSPFQWRGVKALATTLTLLNAMAAPATTGLSRPSAAKGIATTL